MDPVLRERLQTEGMDEWFAAALPEARAELADRVVAAATALLDLGPAPPVAPPGAPPVAPLVASPVASLVAPPVVRLAAHTGTYEELLASLVAWLSGRLGAPSYPYDATLTMALARRLASLGEPDAVLVSLLHDLAEILTLPRARRAEYRHHRLGGAPWRISKLLLEYAVKALAVERVVAALCRDFCAERCPDPPVGCCHILGYDLGLVPEALLELQALEAAWRASAAGASAAGGSGMGASGAGGSGVGGWAPLAAGAPEDKCRYHTLRGCVLARSKSPACSGALCAALGAYLPSEVPTALLDPILEALAAFRNCDLDRERVFDCMDALVRVGAPLFSRF